MSPQPPPADEERRPSASQALGEGLAAAAKKSGIAPADQAPSGAALLAAMGGVRGIVETVVPGLVFVIVFTFSQNVPLSLGASVALAVAFTVVRVVRRSQATQAVAGLIGVGASAILALITGRGSDNYVLGLATDAAYGAAMLVSMAVRWPLVGLAAGYLMGDGTAWRADRAKMAAMQLITGCWLALFVARLAVQLPLYFGNDVAALGITKLIMGIPLYAPLLLVTWLVVRSVYPKHGEPEK